MDNQGRIEELRSMLVFNKIQLNSFYGLPTNYTDYNRLQNEYTNNVNELRRLLFLEERKNKILRIKEKLSDR